MNSLFKTIETNKCQLFVAGNVPLSSDITLIKPNIFRYTTNDNWFTDLELPDGNWENLGRLESINKSQARNIVDDIIIRDVIPVRVAGYRDSPSFINYHFPLDLQYENNCRNPKESLLSLIEEHCLLKNKYEDIWNNLSITNSENFISEYIRISTLFFNEEKLVFRNPILLKNEKT